MDTGNTKDELRIPKKEYRANRKVPKAYSRSIQSLDHTVNSWGPLPKQQTGTLHKIIYA